MTEKGRLSLRGVAATTETATTAETAKTRHGRLLALYFVGQAKEGKVLFRTAKTVKTAKTIMKATPLNFRLFARGRKNNINFCSINFLETGWGAAKSSCSEKFMLGIPCVLQ